MLYVDPSELRETSNFKRYIGDMVYIPLDELEYESGADLLIAPSKFMAISDVSLLPYAISHGSKLIQLKFGHDIAGSIIDRRLPRSLSKMLSLGAQSWQSVLQFIGIFGCSFDNNMMATINGQLSYTDPPMSWHSIDEAFGWWIERGGSLGFPISSPKLLPEKLRGYQNRIDVCIAKPMKMEYPQKPAFYKEIEESSNFIVQEWQAAQKLERVEDLRQVLCALPKVRIGPEKAQAIYDWMIKNDIIPNLNSFIQIVNNGWITEVKGIGPKLEEKMKEAIYD
jgi:hypothetical protein